MTALGEHFRAKEERVKSALKDKHRWFIKARQDARRHAEIRADEEGHALTLAVTVAMATENEMRALLKRLDTLEEATVRALMQNQEELDALEAERRDMLARAHVLPDGRRAFRSEDGNRVFDENGREVGRAVIASEAISRDKPSWESMHGNLRAAVKLQAERKRLLEYQDMLDAARERIGEGKIPKSELDRIEADLETSMPASVRAQMAWI